MKRTLLMMALTAMILALTAAPALAQGHGKVKGDFQPDWVLGGWQPNIVEGDHEPDVVEGG